MKINNTITTVLTAEERATVATTALLLNDISKVIADNAELRSAETGEVFTAEDLLRVMGILTGIAVSEHWMVIG